MDVAAAGVDTKFLRALRVILTILLGIAFLALVAYGYVYIRAYELVLSLASNFFWIDSGTATLVAIVFAGAAAAPVLFSYYRACVRRARVMDYVLLSCALAVTVVSAYINRYKFFVPGKEFVFICAPILADEGATLERLGRGESEGRRCVQVTAANAASARAIERRKAPQQIRLNLAQMHDMEWFKEGVAAVYVGNMDGPDGLPKLFNGPGFDPDTPEFLQPITVEKIREIKEIQRKKELSLAEAAVLASEHIKRKQEEQIEKLAAAQKEQQAILQRQEAEVRAKANREALEERRREEEDRARHEKNERLRLEAIATAERSRLEAQQRRDQQQRDVVQSRRRIELHGTTFVIPRGYCAIEYSMWVKFYVNGTSVDPSPQLCRRYDGAIHAAGSNMVGADEPKYVVIERMQ